MRGGCPLGDARSHIVSVRILLNKWERSMGGAVDGAKTYA